MKEFKNSLFTVDSVLFSILDDEICVLLAKRAIEPFIGSWGLAGGFVDLDKDASTEITALRKLKEKTSIEPPFLEQLQTFSGSNRDPRGWSVTQAYWALMDRQKAEVNISTVDDVKWFKLSELNDVPVAFDHRKIIDVALNRMRQKALYSFIPAYCLPDEFTIAHLLKTLEIIIGTKIQPRSIYRRIESSGALEEVEGKSKSKGRSAKLYRVARGAEKILFDRNIGL